MEKHDFLSFSRKKQQAKTAPFSKLPTKKTVSIETVLNVRLSLLSDLLCDLCSLALTIAEIIKLCSSDLTLTNNVDVIDLG